MNVGDHLFRWQEVHLIHFYIYLVIAALIAYYLVKKSNSEYKFELFFLSFYVLTGNLNEILTISIPGFSLFEIQPKRFLLLILSFFLIKKILFSREKVSMTSNGKIPWWEIMLYAYFIFFVISQFANIAVIGISEILVNLSFEFTFLVIILALRLMANDESYQVLGKSILIGATLSSILSIIQIAIDPYFLRIGIDRIAFGETIRANGMFDQEHYNSYFLITAIIWTIVLVKRKNLKIILISLYTIGIILSFHRMSWLILSSVLIIYFLFIDNVILDKLILAGLSGIAIILAVFIFYHRDIMDTSLVQERLTDSVDGREGYYTMVMENIHKKPLFGYGGRNNEVYYSYMLKITGRVGRATGTEGGIHSGYFSAMFYTGIPVFFFFTMFALLSVFYFAKLSLKDRFFAIPFFIAFIFLVGNLTNTLMFSKHVGVFYALHLGIAMGVKQKIDLSKSDS